MIALGHGLWVKTFAGTLEREMAAALREVLGEQADEAAVAGIGDNAWLTSSDQVNRLVYAVNEKYTAIISKEAAKAAKQIGVRMDDLGDRPRVRMMMSAKVNHMARSMAATSKKRLDDIRDRLASGEITQAQADAEVKQAFGFDTDASTATAAGRDRYDNARANLAAETEGQRAATTGQRLAWRESGIVRELKWVAVMDGRTCMFCAQLHGSTVPIDEVWFNQDETQIVTDAAGREHRLTYSYDKLDGPPVHPRCRCKLVPVLVRGTRRRDKR